MAQPLNRPTWFVLPPGGLLPAEDASNILGAIVLDWERPNTDYIPKKEPALSKIEAKSVRTLNDMNFWATYSRTENNKARVYLGKWFNLTFGKSIGDGKLRQSAQVRTVVLNQQNDIFHDLYSDPGSSAAMRNMFRQAKHDFPQNNKYIFMVVGVKILFDAEVEQSCSRDSHTSINLGAPLNLILAATTGFILPLDADPGIGLARKQQTSSSTGFVASGARIGALQYRLISNRAEWKSGTGAFPFPRLQHVPHIGSYHTPPENIGYYGPGASADNHGDPSLPPPPPDFKNPDFTMHSSSLTALLAPEDETAEGELLDGEQELKGLLVIW